MLKCSLNFCTFLQISRPLSGMLKRQSIKELPAFYIKVRGMQDHVRERQSACVLTG